MTTENDISGLHCAFVAATRNQLALEWMFDALGTDGQAALAELCVTAGLEFLSEYFDRRAEPDASIRRIAAEVIKLITTRKIIVQIQPPCPGAESLRVPTANRILVGTQERTILLVPPGWVNDVLAAGSIISRVEALASLTYGATLAEHLTNQAQYLLHLIDCMGMAAFALGGSGIPSTDDQMADLEEGPLADHRERTAWEMAVGVLRAAAEETGYSPQSEPFSTWLSGPRGWRKAG